jgi:hypothetical protein
MMALLLILLADGRPTIAAPKSTEPRGEQHNPFGLPGEWSSILRQEPVLKELQLTPKQAESIQTILKNPKLTTEESRKKIGEVVNADQARRLKQISWRTSGGFALFEPEVATALGISSEQEQKLSEISRKENGEMRSFMSRARFRSREAMNNFIADRRTHTSDLLLAVLSSGQRRKFEELKGK